MSRTSIDRCFLLGLDLVFTGTRFLLIIYIYIYIGQSSCERQTCFLSFKSLNHQLIKGPNKQKNNFAFFTFGRFVFIKNSFISH